MYDMSMNKQALSCDKYIRIMFHYFKYSLHLFKPSTVLGLEYSVLTRSILCRIDKSSQFCNTGNKYEVAIACAFWCKLRRPWTSEHMDVRQICKCLQLSASIGS